jgi:hypothetical protein
MHPQLQAVIDELDSASERQRRLAATVPPGRWAERPGPERWSVGECIAHLNLTSQAYIPRIAAILADAPRTGAPARFRRDFLGWLIWRVLKPGGRSKAKTTAEFIPTGSEPAADIIATFEDLQRQQVQMVRQSDGMPLHRLKVGSPFSDKMKYSVYSALTILPRHQHRHLLQAERAWAEISARG